MLWNKKAERILPHRLCATNFKYILSNSHSWISSNNSKAASLAVARSRIFSPWYSQHLSQKSITSTYLRPLCGIPSLFQLAIIKPPILYYIHFDIVCTKKLQALPPTVFSTIIFFQPLAHSALDMSLHRMWITDNTAILCLMH